MDGRSLNAWRINLSRSSPTEEATAKLRLVELVPATPPRADPASVIENGGMKVAGPKTSTKPVLDVRLDTQSAVVLHAPAKLLYKGKTLRCFNWQYTLDGGKTWITAPSTPYAQTSIAGLPSMTTCGFRVSVTHKGGQSEWSPTVDVVVP